MTKKNKINYGPLEPYDLEIKKSYLNRFVGNKDMKELYGESHQCKQIAEQVWKDRMLDATVTVKLLNGDEYFLY